MRAYVSRVGACSEPVNSCSADAIATASQLCTFACVRLYEWWPQPDSHDNVTPTCHDYTFFQCDIKFVISERKNPIILNLVTFNNVFRKFVHHFESAIFFRKANIKFVISDRKNPLSLNIVKLDNVFRKVVRNFESAI